MFVASILVIIHW